MDDREILLKLKEVRDYVDSLTEDVGNTNSHGEALATLGAVTDEIEKRLPTRWSGC